MREEILLKRLYAGDESALEELIALYYPDILRYCIWHAPDRNLAEDAVQETFLKAVKYLGACRFSGSFKAFLYKIALNTCRDMQKNKWSKHISLEDGIEEPGYAEKGFVDAEEALVIRAYVKKQDSLSQEIILLRFLWNLKLREIAEITGLPMRTVQSKLRAALKQIKTELQGGDC
ncbi:MAG: sigma-70 family RNA polymerase sigma factor [Blautia sp.]|nr:sigma-70 family RNA polymerase sigma factor [Lachnoclostridium sp.]MCM1211410.1 sigma-70 family RNA polymerase sigma factor [Blautia sp.]